MVPNKLLLGTTLVPNKLLFGTTLVPNKHFDILKLEGLAPYGGLLLAPVEGWWLKTT